MSSKHAGVEFASEVSKKNREAVDFFGKKVDLLASLPVIAFYQQLHPLTNFKKLNRRNDIWAVHCLLKWLQVSVYKPQQTYVFVCQECNLRWLRQLQEKSW